MTYVVKQIPAALLPAWNKNLLIFEQRMCFDLVTFSVPLLVVFFPVKMQKPTIHASFFLIYFSSATIHLSKGFQSSPHCFVCFYSLPYHPAVPAHQLPAAFKGKAKEAIRCTYYNQIRILYLMELGTRLMTTLPS